MIDRWRDSEAEAFSQDPLSIRIYTSRLLGREPDLVLHGGGNTSVKMAADNIFGDTEQVLFVKGSGQDMARIDRGGFSPLRMAVLERLLALGHVEDADLVRVQRSAMVDPSAPDPSIETLLHALIPYRFVDHTHADAVVTISNTDKGEQILQHLYGDRVLVVPYVHPGFVLAKTVLQRTKEMDWRSIDALVILKHGVFTFADEAKTAYERMIRLATVAENYLVESGCSAFSPPPETPEDLHALCRIRRLVAQVKDRAVVARLDQSGSARAFADMPRVAAAVSRGPLAADHLLRAKPAPVVLNSDPEQDINAYVESYRAYFHRHAGQGGICPDTAPGWAVWPRHGIIAFGETYQEARVVHDIAAHTVKAVRCGEALGGWRGLSEAQVFAMEHWPIQRAKRKKDAVRPQLQGKVALVTGAASGIGRACAEMLHRQGAAVAGLDVNPEIERIFEPEDLTGLVCDITEDPAVKAAVARTVRRFGGLDIVIPNAGIFSASRNIEDLDDETWNRSIAVNLSANQRLLKHCIPFLKTGIDATVVFIASKNVPAPGPGASAYSVAKAGVTQLARVAALELGPYGIRVNVIHPNAVYDTAIWTPEVLESRACRYGCTVEEYKTNNCLKTEVRARDVAELVCAMVGPAFAKTTGAQIPIDGGNERVI